LTEPFGQFWKEGVMPIRELNLSSLPIRRQNTLNPSRADATVIAFQPLSSTEAGPSSFGRAGSSRGYRPSSPATVIPFLLPRSSPRAQWVLPRSQSPARSAKRADQELITDEERYRQRMFENLLAAAWVGTLMSAGYYMLNVLAAPSM
jgi:hypothetical protein